MWFSYKCPICAGRHKPDISNTRYYLDRNTTRYASPREEKTTPRDGGKNDIDLDRLAPTQCPLEHGTPMGSSIFNSVMESTSHNRYSEVGHALPTNVTKRGELVHDPARYMTRSMPVSDAK